MLSEETYRSILGLRVVRKYQDTEIRQDHLDAILESARWTGSSKNRQSWVFVVVKDRATIESLAECGDFTTPLREAPLVIVPVMLADGYEWDMGRVSQNIMLAAATLGIGTCPVTLHREECAKTTLAVPSDHSCRYAIALGYPDQDLEEVARARSPLGGRKPTTDVVRYERFGQ